jgi:two-component system response regulator ChvI
MDAPPRPPIQRLLLVDDDRLMTGILAAALGEEGYAVECVHDGKQALRRCRESPPDLVLLDVQLPEMDGLEVCRRLREHTRLPIILLTSRAEEVDRVTGLDLGADDYVTKPFSTRELCARIRALSRRLEPAAGATAAAAGYSKASTLLSAEPVRAGDLVLDTARFEARWQGKRVALTRSEFEVLLVLASRRGRVLSREQLLDAVRGDEVVVTDRTVDTFIKRLRKKLRETDPAFDRIETVFGVGYRYRE